MSAPAAVQVLPQVLPLVGVLIGAAGKGILDYFSDRRGYTREERARYLADKRLAYTAVLLHADRVRRVLGSGGDPEQDLYALLTAVTDVELLAPPGVVATLEGLADARVDSAHFVPAREALLRACRADLGVDALSARSKQGRSA